MTEIISLCQPDGETKRAATLPEIKRIISPRKGVKITGKRTGRLTMVREEIKGLKVNPNKVFVQT